MVSTNDTLNDESHDLVVLGSLLSGGKDGILHTLPRPINRSIHGTFRVS